MTDRERREQAHLAAIRAAAAAIAAADHAVRLATEAGLPVPAELGRARAQLVYWHRDLSASQPPTEHDRRR